MSGTDRLRHLRQGGVHEPGRLSQGSHRPGHHSRRGARRRAAARRRDRRGHRRQHRHRPHPGRQCPGLRVRDRDAAKRQRGEGPPAGDAGRGAAAGARGPPTRRQPPLYPHRPADRRGRALGGAHGAIWARQFDNLANRDIHYATTGQGDLAANRRQGGRLHLRGGHRRHSGGCGPRTCGSTAPG